MWTQLYTNYQIPQYFSAQTRFRTGEMPIMFFDYTLYNTLSVFAPEINGLWGMRELPGFEDENGNIVNSIPISGLGSIIMSSTDSPEACWKFLEWLTRAETQIMYGREIESVLGIASRYNTANVEAIRQLPWTRQDREVLLSQLENTVGIPEVPGGYYMPRSIEFAIRKVLDKGFDPKEALLEYVPAINTEIRYKRDEFGLD